MYSILIVEDEYLLRSELVLCEDWQALGFDPPMLAEDGEQALSMALTRCPDVVLTDIRMPRRDGLSLLKQLQKQPCICIVLSGYDDFHYAVEAMRYGVIDYLLKPVDEKRLHAALAEAVSRLEERRETEGTEPEALPGSNLYLQQASAYIQQHYAEDIHISDVAQALFITDDYLGRLFIREYRMKFSDYLNQQRIQHSIALLRDPKWKLYQVAQQCGYRDQQYFSNVFKKMMGLSPNQFRHSLSPGESRKETL